MSLMLANQSSFTSRSCSIQLARSTRPLARLELAQGIPISRWIRLLAACTNHIANGADISMRQVKSIRNKGGHGRVYS